MQSGLRHFGIGRGLPKVAYSDSRRSFRRGGLPVVLYGGLGGAAARHSKIGADTSSQRRNAARIGLSRRALRQLPGGLRQRAGNERVFRNVGRCLARHQRGARDKLAERFGVLAERRLRLIVRNADRLPGFLNVGGRRKRHRARGAIVRVVHLAELFQGISVRRFARPEQTEFLLGDTFQPRHAVSRRGVDLLFEPIRSGQRVAGQTDQTFGVADQALSESLGDIRSGGRFGARRCGRGGRTATQTYVLIRQNAARRRCRCRRAAEAHVGVGEERRVAHGDAAAGRQPLPTHVIGPFGVM